MSRGRDDLYKVGYEPLLVLAFTKVTNEKKFILYLLLRATLDDTAQQTIRDYFRISQADYAYKKYYFQFTSQLNELIKDQKNNYKSAFQSKDFDVEQSRKVNTFLMSQPVINNFILENLNVKNNLNLHQLINGYFNLSKSEEKKAKLDFQLSSSFTINPGALELLVTEVRNHFAALKFSQREALWCMLGTPFNETEREIAAAWMDNKGKKFQKLIVEINEKITELMAAIPLHVYESVMVPFLGVNKSVEAFRHIEAKVYEFFAIHPIFYQYICQLLENKSFMRLLDAYDLVLKQRNELSVQYKSTPFRMVESLVNATNQASPKARGRSRDEKPISIITRSYSVGHSRVFLITDSEDDVMPPALNKQPKPTEGPVLTYQTESNTARISTNNPGILYIDDSSLNTTLDDSIEEETRELDRLQTKQNQCGAKLDDECLYIYSIDYAQTTQGNSIEGVDDLVNFIADSINANEYKTVTIMNGTSRQSFMLDQHFSEQREDFDENIYIYNEGISCFVALPEIFNAINAKTTIKCNFNKYLLIDSFLKLNPGEAYADARERTIDLNFQARSLEAKCPDDQSKMLMLYAQMHMAASSAPKKRICFNYFCKSMSEANALDACFTENLELVPFNVTMNIYFYMAGLVQKTGSLQGNSSGLIDFDYEENLHVLLDSNDDSDADIDFPEEEVLQSQRYNDMYQLALNFNAIHFLRHKSYTLSSKVNLNHIPDPVADVKPSDNKGEEDKPSSREQPASPLRFFRSFTPVTGPATSLHDLPSPEGLDDCSPSC